MDVTTTTPILVPKFNSLYGSLRSTDGWRFISDNYASGSISTTVNTTVTGAVSLVNSPHFRLKQWPGAVQVYLMLRFFGIAPQTVPTANAGMECLFIDNSGNTTPIGEYLSQSGGNGNPFAILPLPITDTEATSVGTLSIALANVANSNATYKYSIGFSYVYVLPSVSGYEIQLKEGTSHYYETSADDCMPANVRASVR